MNRNSLVSTSFVNMQFSEEEVKLHLEPKIGDTVVCISSKTDVEWAPHPGQSFKVISKFGGLYKLQSIDINWKGCHGNGTWFSNLNTIYSEKNEIQWEMGK